MGIRIIWPWQRKKKRLQAEFQKWYRAGVRTTPTGTVVDPPWVVYPEEEPWGSGWRQGNKEGWLHYVWLPFWRSMDNEARAEYIEQWNAPSEWRSYLIETTEPENSKQISSADHILNLHLFK